MKANTPVKRVAAKVLPPAAARFGKRVTANARYRAQARQGRTGFARHGDAYRRRVLFIAGLPKSGTTWLEEMVASFPGFAPALVPDATRYEMKHGRSHDYELPGDLFDRFDDMLVVTKMHVHGSPHNVEVLRRADVPYVVLYRDLRDVAVSFCHYVRRTPWHPEHAVYRRLSPEEGLAIFALRTLGDYAQWVRSWHRNRDPERSLELRYEAMLVDPRGALERVARLFELDADPAHLARIVEEHSFQRRSGGRVNGQAGGGFLRKGVAGDWRRVFTPTLVDLYKTIIGDFLIELGYETGDDWGTDEKAPPRSSSASFGTTEMERGLRLSRV